MKAFQTQSLDSLDAYKYVDLPTPEPRGAEIRIAIKACGVGYVDALVGLGRYQVKPPLPYVPGIEIAGVVDATGPEVSGYKAGDRVMSMGVGGGGFAEYGVFGGFMTTKIPDRLGFAEAAAMRINYTTALYALRERGNLQKGEKLLVFGAAGGVGVAAVQIGKLLGAEVIAAASTEEKRAFAKAHGADHVIDTNPEGWRDRLKALGGKADAVFDPVCGPLFEPAFRSLSWKGRYLVIGFAGGGGNIPALPANLPLIKGSALIGVDVRQYMILEVPAYMSALSDIMGWVADGRLSPVAGRAFPFNEARAALEFALTGQGLGKTVLTIP
ncbi:MAG TPA: NADPH:quinone oxidoreductase family protein [Rhizomicrobium sp.]|nr:NADPH:quinone oxidoreductase family protein [Rhizomicrobium sp.]